MPIAFINILPSINKLPFKAEFSLESISLICKTLKIALKEAHVSTLQRKGSLNYADSSTAVGLPWLEFNR